MLCARLDRNIARAEKLRGGQSRKMFLQIAADAREQLRLLDH
jgi:hypothetical protein